MKQSDIKVDLIDHMGSDLSVSNAARVSFSKEGVWDEDDQGNKVLAERDERLIKYLAVHNHWTPFSHCFLSFRIKVPIFVARQLAKHQVGLTINEESRRYIDEEPEFYIPDGFRKRADNVKQGSSDEVVDYIHVEQAHTVVPPALFTKHFCQGALQVYNMLLGAGVAPEQARMVLPQNAMTNFIWSGSLYAFARVCNLRLDPHAQKESRHVAELISAAAKEHYPVSWKYLVSQ